MKAAFFSVLIANYNNARYLRNCLESVLYQTFQDFEIVIVDDCSTDDSDEIYALYSPNEKIRIFKNDVNSGCGYAKRRCADLALGEWCCFLDPDDTLRVDALEIFYKAIQQHSEYKAFFSHMYVCDENMNVIFDQTFPYGSPAWQEFIHYQKAINLFCYKRDVYKCTVGIDELLKQSVDIDLYYKLSEHTDFFYIEQPLYYYRNNPLSISKNKSMATATHLWVMIQSLQRQGVSEDYIINEIVGFYEWRTKGFQHELNQWKTTGIYKTYSLWKTIKKKLKLLILPH